ncbi:DNA excision repair protein ERCC-6 [Habropoda laboriosa]|uniref:DNA repair and recombination protein RAD54-like n=1 Tax=Habropoda laboriosa TaxID=597456 RepID=A0A0L7QLV0_9HYME|nr:DNA excision repair protein ERCC-6 [Habropoda laboriosa]
METDGQGQNLDIEKLNDTHVNKIIDENLTTKEFEGLNHNSENNTTNCSKQKELQKQVLTGEITPFQAIEKQSNSSRTKGTFNKSSHLLDLEKYLQQQAELAKQRKQLKENSKASKHNSNQAVPIKKIKLSNTNSKECKLVEKVKPKVNKKKLLSELETAKHLNKNYDVNSSDSGSEYVPSDEQIDSEDEEPSSKKRKSVTKTVHTKRVLDDGDEEMYRQRVKESRYPKNEPLHKIDNLFKVPQSIWKKLYKYQRVSVQWLWELHSRALGGLVGDEMGLGKTVQVIAFLAGLDSSELLSDGGRFRGLGPTIVICPATLMEQWVKHFHEWWPILRVVVLHQSGTYNGDLEYLMHSLKSGGILITSYSGMLRHKDLLIASQWHYIILDEGHKIRNPQAKVSKAVKEFSTPHRLLLTGSPMQNSLKELWSLFDFILPGKLGTLPAFLEHCASPITRGGYANASPLQEATALQVATMLKEAISPYMLRRTKNDVQHHVSLPEKNEQILFCSLTEEQKKLYKKYLRSEDVSYVLHERSHTETGRYRARLLIALSALRKICNHPDLFLYTNPVDSDEDLDVSEESLEKFGFWKRSGKMTVIRSLLKIWKKQGHRVLLFTQGRQMMHILESLVQTEEYIYLRMDGTTPMSQRQETICLFNNDSSYFVFLLTTRVGGLGVNLTGANRVIIYDPDWNPATDAQARERAWRIGQNKRVTIYRLITAGTIEEKIYHRQVFKLLLSNKVLEDPRQRRLFKTSDLVELFNLNESIDGHSSESDQLFRESRLTPPTTKFSSNKIEKMRKLAATLSKNISQNTSNSTVTTQTANVSENICTSSCHNNKVNQDILQNNNKISENSVPKQNIQTENQLHEKDENEVLSENQKSTNEAKTEENEILTNAEHTTENNSKIDDKVESENHMPTNSTWCDSKMDVISNEVTVQNSSGDCNTVKLSHKSVEMVSSTTNEDMSLKLNTMHHTHKQNKKSSRLQKSTTSALFEGERISHLIGRRLGCSETNEPKSMEDDQYVLQKLFAKASNYFLFIQEFSFYRITISR